MLDATRSSLPSSPARIDASGDTNTPESCVLPPSPTSDAMVTALSAQRDHETQVTLPQIRDRWRPSAWHTQQSLRYRQRVATNNGHSTAIAASAHAEARRPVHNLRNHHGGVVVLGGVDQMEIDLSGCSWFVSKITDALGPRSLGSRLHPRTASHDVQWLLGVAKREAVN